MQVLKKLSLFLAFVCAACSTSRDITDKGGVRDFNTDISEINISNTDSFRVGVLLPLSGTAARHGQGLKNASMIAADDIKNPNLILQYYDTEGNPSGARVAAENAIRQGAKVIIGPLMSVEVQAIANETIYQGVPVVAFSTAQEVLQPTVYTMGLLVEEQVNRIVTYAAAQGRQRLALLIPDNSTGNAVARAAVKAAQKNNIEMSAIAYYPPETSDFSGIIKPMTNYDERHKELLKIREELTAKAEMGNKGAEYKLKQIETKEGIGDIGFDMILIPESGAKLTSIISMFAYYDAIYPDVQFLGTSMWEGGKYNKESMMQKAWYPTISRAHSGYFAGKYNQIFGERPSSLYSFSYDAIALANALAQKNTENINQAITIPDGYVGINGAFRFFEDGTNQHSLDVMEIRANGDAVIDAAPRQFTDNGSNQKLPSVDVDNGYVAPKIFGKDEQAAQIAIYGNLLPVPESEPIAEENQISLEN